ncbi:uncharacterized protein LOC113306345 [Papaver somniferum]|uniref:uncharacterized protein LOC113306345 n=1 Tax=Papaver somniferum TaxID=3469 RepID=UPI000E6FF43E|nr:uncharacterized protein LOC113306345 [Papaver somniferum]
MAFLRACNPNIAFLTETLIGESNAYNVYSSLGFDNYRYISANGRSGDWDLLCVYGPPEKHLRSRFWSNLSHYAAQIPNPWCIMGDLNVIQSMRENKGGNQTRNAANGDFKNFIQDMGLIDMGFTGPTFTWSNGAVVEKPIFERLDKAMCTPDWFFMFQNNVVLHLPRISSDHAPILVNTHRTTKLRRKHSNKFEYFWVDHPAFKDVVKNSWNSTHHNIMGKLSSVGEDLNKWIKEAFGNIFRAVEDTKEKLLKVQMEAHGRDTRAEETELCKEIDKLNLLQ